MTLSLLVLFAFQGGLCKLTVFQSGAILFSFSKVQKRMLDYKKKKKKKPVQPIILLQHLPHSLAAVFCVVSAIYGLVCYSLSYSIPQTHS